MAGMAGFEHKCDSPKTKLKLYKQSLKNSPFSHAQVSMIWDFYVTHSLSEGSSQTYTLENYGWDMAENTRKKTLITIEEQLSKVAGIEKLCCIRTKDIKDTLGACDLWSEQICVEHPRIVIMQSFAVTVDENEIIKFAGGGENRIKCLFRHIRNSFAHGNTYFFDNGMVLLEDKDGSKITARILVRQKTLLDWISIIDKDKKYYELIDVCKLCPQETSNCTV